MLYGTIFKNNRWLSQKQMPKIINFVAYSWAVRKGLEIIVKNLYRENYYLKNFYFTSCSP